MWPVASGHDDETRRRNTIQTYMAPHRKFGCQKIPKKRNTRDCVATKARSVGDTRTCGANLLPKSLRDLEKSLRDRLRRSVRNLDNII